MLLLVELIVFWKVNFKVVVFAFIVAVWQIYLLRHKSLTAAVAFIHLNFRKSVLLLDILQLFKEVILTRRITQIFMILMIFNLFQVNDGSLLVDVVNLHVLVFVDDFSHVLLCLLLLSLCDLLLVHLSKSSELL